MDLYLPLSAETVAAVLEQPPDMGDRLAALSGPELSALCVLQRLPDLHARGQPSATVERLLAGFIAASQEGSDDHPHRLAAEVLRRFEPDALAAGLALLDDMGLGLLEPAEVSARAYLLADGAWDFDYTRNRQDTPSTTDDPHYQIAGLPHALSAEQFRVTQVLQAEIEEPLHIQGYAGTGKSHLINVMIDLLGTRGVAPGSILVLAQTWAQLQALMQRLPGSVTGLTYNDLITEIIPKGLLDKTQARMRSRSRQTHQLLIERVVSVFGLTGIGNTSAYAIARASRDTLFRYCTSGDQDLLAKHLPRRFKNEIAAGHTAAESELLETVAIRSAERLWQETLNPTSTEFQPPVRGYHQIKYAALQGLGIPALYSHVIIDESHDLSQAMLQVIDHSLPTCITLGDDYQNLAGHRSHHEAKTRERAIVTSYRAGHQLEGIINPIITNHPVAPKALFVGSDEVTTEVIFYQKPAIPERPATILVTDLWAIWEWAQRLAQNRVRFTLYASAKDLGLFVQDCIELRAHGTRPRHGALARYRSWDQLAQALGANRAFVGIHKLLQRGYAWSDWESAMTWVQTEASPSSYGLGTLEAAKNREFDAVMLGPDCADRMWATDQHDKAAMGATGSALYIGATRVRQRLMAPESLRNWIEEMAGKG